jgi:Protein of unknown function (DUF4089)
MTAASDDPLRAYVRAALTLQGHGCDESQIAEIVEQFARLELMARTVFDCPIPFASGPAPVFRP